MNRGTILSLPVPQAAEIMADAGFEWVLIDMEHSSLGLGEVHNIINAAGDRLLKIVRVPGNDEIWIKRIIDLGCDGILVPMVNTREAAEAAVSSSLYPPAGRRSVGLSRAHRYGPGFGEYVAGANSKLIVMIQIEHIDAVRNLDDILSVNGISAIFIGPYDLSASMGLTGQTGHPEVVAAIDTVKSKCNSARLPWGIFSLTPEGLDKHIADGCTYALCATDSFMLAGEAARISARLGSAS